MSVPKQALLEHPYSLAEWSEQCKWFGKYNLYERRKPIVEDFYNTFILKKLLPCYLQVQIKTLTKLKNAHKEEYALKEFCNKYLDGEETFLPDQENFLKYYRS